MKTNMGNLDWVVRAIAGVIPIGLTVAGAIGV